MRWLELEYYSIPSGKLFRDLIFQRSRRERLPENLVHSQRSRLFTDSAVERLTLRKGILLGQFHEGRHQMGGVDLIRFPDSVSASLVVFFVEASLQFADVHDHHYTLRVRQKGKNVVLRLCLRFRFYEATTVHAIHFLCFFFQ